VCSWISDDDATKTETFPTPSTRDCDRLDE
jgi:hypothetical protein